MTADQKIRYVFCPRPDCRAYWTSRFNPEGWTLEERDRLLASHEQLRHGVER